MNRLVSAARLLGTVLVLKHNQARFQRSEKSQGQDDDQRPPNDRVHPIGGMKHDFGDERAARDNRTNDQDNKNRRAIARLKARIIEPADRTRFRNLEKTMEQASLTATRTASQNRPSNDRSGIPEFPAAQVSTTALAPQT